MKLKVSLIAIFTIVAFKSFGQILTQEDSLSAGLIYKQQATVISGYGEAKYGIDTKRKSAEASLKRLVLFVGHKLSNKISLFTELEVEDALVANGSTSSKGEVSMEQAFLKFNVNPNTYLVAGLFAPRVGIINENHLPTTFNGVDRPFLEEQIIPSTWREVGVGLYGQFTRVAGLNYSISVTNGLNSEGFNSTNGIGDGRQLGQAANGLNIGINAALLYYAGDFRLQASGYIGGSTAKEQRVADSLHLSSGPFGNPVTLGEIDGQYNKSGIGIRAIATIINIKNADAINRAFANNTPETMYGGYAELGYDLLYPSEQGKKSFILFGRYEYLNMNAKIPSNGLENKANEKHYIVGGFTYKPIRGVSIKGDYVKRITGDFNQALVVTPFPQQVPYFKNNGFINLGVAYNF